MFQVACFRFSIALVMPARVILRDLKKRYGSVHAVDGVSFEVNDSEIFGLLGPNGAGKTTTIECILGLREPDEGDIEVCGLDARRQPGEVKQRIGAALQTTTLQDKITPREALKLFGSFYRTSAEPLMLLGQFGLADKAEAPFGALSGGQQQRLAVALAFVNKPELVFLDEPTTGLDPAARRELHEDIKRMKREGHTVLLTTHYMDEAEQLCDRVAIINRGRILAMGTPRELIAQSSTIPLVSLCTSREIDAELLARLPDVQELKCDGTNVRFRSGNVRHTLGRLMDLLDAQAADIVALHVQKATLEDVFIHLTGENVPFQKPRTPREFFRK